MTKTQTQTQTKPADVAATRLAPGIPWPMLPVAALVKATPGLPEADPELTADMEANKLTDPLYVETDEQGRHRLYDGRRRLASALAAGWTHVPVTHRPMIRVKALTAHPDNTRENLDLNPEFIASLKTYGCEIPVLIQRLDDGTVQVDDGNRRYYGAETAGLTHLPYAWKDTGRDTASQFLGMLSTATHRTGLTDREKAQTLFRAMDAGAGVKAAAQAAGMTQKSAKAAAAVGGSKAAAAVAPSWSFDDLESLRKLEEADAEAAARITTEHGDNPHEGRWQIQRALKAAAVRQKAEAHRAELEAAKARILTAEELGDKAAPLYSLATVPNAEEHATCQGHVWVLEPHADRYTAYCTNAPFFGHVQEKDQDEQRQERDEAKANRAAVRAGNLDWDTATEARREWLRQLIGRRVHTKAQTEAMGEMVTEALLGGSQTLAEKMNGHHTDPILARILGVDEKTSRAQMVKKAATKDAKRRPVLMFAVLAAAHETRMTRKAWRTDDQRDIYHRHPAAHWLKTLCDHLGYEPHRIEAAVRDDETYRYEAPKPQADALG